MRKIQIVGNMYMCRTLSTYIYIFKLINNYFSKTLETLAERGVSDVG